MNYLGSFLEQWGGDSVADIVVWLRAGVRRIMVQLPLGVSDLSVLQNIQTFYVPYPASYLMGKKRSFSEKTASFMKLAAYSHLVPT
jgi:hypothetical protein